MLRRWFKKSELEVVGGTVVGKSAPDEQDGWVKVELVQLPGHPLPGGEAVPAKQVIAEFRCPHCTGALLPPDSVDRDQWL